MCLHAPNTQQEGAACTLTVLCHASLPALRQAQEQAVHLCRSHAGEFTCRTRFQQDVQPFLLTTTGNMHRW
jgi:hypothetical protein